MSFPEIDALREESDALAVIVSDLDDDRLLQPTQFKHWTIADILGHLYVWNDAATLTLADSDAFTAFFNRVAGNMASGGQLRDYEQGLLAGKTPGEIRDAWQQSVHALCQLYDHADPKQRVKWGGPDMSVRSCISARLMETWAHGQAVFDSAGIERIDSDRIRSIVVLGVNTFAFNFRINGLDVPARLPTLTLLAPSGAVWRYGDDDSNTISGNASEFCQVVTQTRNIADTALAVSGETATQWMRIAQCFAGPPNPPPPPGSRCLQTY